MYTAVSTMASGTAKPRSVKATGRGLPQDDILANREIVGFAMGERMTAELAQQALRAARRFGTPQAGY